MFVMNSERDFDHVDNECLDLTHDIHNIETGKVVKKRLFTTVILTKFMSLIQNVQFTILTISEVGGEVHSEKS